MALAIVRACLRGNVCGCEGGGLWLLFVGAVFNDVHAGLREDVV